MKALGWKIETRQMTETRIPRMAGRWEWRITEPTNLGRTGRTVSKAIANGFANSQRKAIKDAQRHIDLLENGETEWRTAYTHRPGNPSTAGH